MDVDGGDVSVALDIEATYAAAGPYTVSSDTSDPDYHVFYPDETTDDLPVIVWEFGWWSCRYV